MIHDVKEFFGLEKEFKNADFFETENYRTIFQDVVSAIKEGHIIAMTGIVGSGKTVTARRIRKDLQKRNEVLVSNNLAVEKVCVNLGTLIFALFSDLITDKKDKIPTKLECRERELMELIKRRKKQVALFIDEAHDLHHNTLKGLKRLQEIGQEAESLLAIVLIGHPKLSIDLNKPAMEEIGGRTTILHLEGIRGSEKQYIGWLIGQCLRKDTDPSDVFTEAAIDYMQTLHAKNIAVGWGTIIGILAGLMDSRPHTLSKTVKSICPLIGNSSVSNRNYHSNEIVRVFAAQSSAKPLFWYTPAFVESKTEEQNIKDLENYKVILAAWKQMDVAVVNIGNYPSVPDLATKARYQDKLTKNRAVGRFLSYYYDIQGQIIRSETDFTLQIPLNILSGCKHIIGVCASNTTPSALAGALRSGVITHIIATRELAQAALNLTV